jgi:hypothetical protein
MLFWSLCWPNFSTFCGTGVYPQPALVLGDSVGYDVCVFKLYDLIVKLDHA